MTTISNKIYKGLTTKEVEESRMVHGENVLTPPAKITFFQQLKDICHHSISLVMFACTAISLVFSAAYDGILGNDIWIVPAMVALSTLLIVMVGLFKGFADPLFRVLIAAFVLSMGIAIFEFVEVNAGISVFLEPIGIIVALLLATGVAFFLERSNEKTFHSLNDVNNDTLVKAVRNGNVCQIHRREVVVGDIIILDTGEEVAADALLLDAFNLIVNESTLTGELQANKSTNPDLFDTEATYPSNMILKGTTITEGYCTAEVVAVGDKTESGKVFESAQVSQGGNTPLSQKLDKLAQLITKVSYLIAALVVLGRMIAYFFVDHQLGIDSQEGLIRLVSYTLQTIMIAVTLVVVAVPEGLPMSITLSLAFSMRKLMSQNTLPRTIHSCETMGAAQVICTDKTGTLTQNKMQVKAHCFEDIGQQLTNEMIAVNSTASLDLSDQCNPQPIGNPTEGALLLWINKSGADYNAIRKENKIIDRLPFNTENKYMATLVSSAAMGKDMLYVKGAPEIVLGMADLDQQKRLHYEQLLSQYQSKAMRTLAFAYAESTSLDTENATIKTQIESLLAENKRLTFAGIVAIADPVRDDVPKAIDDCINAGIEIKIVTGDNAATAAEIARQIRLLDDNFSDTDSIMTGIEFAAMSDEELIQRVDKLKILARAKPKDKERLVGLLQQKQLVVAVTGDGTNDAPALNKADVGLSMGDGTAVAKEASDMTIQDNSFRTIANAVMWGRSLYKNIQRFILFQMTVNVAACLIVLIGSFTGTQSPLTVTQMLWVNLIMDTFAAIALASLPPTTTVMREKPRNIGDYIINQPMSINILTVGAAFSLVLLALLFRMQHAEINCFNDIFTVQQKPYNGLSAYELSLFFTIFVMMQFWNMFNAKAFMTGKSAFNNIRNSKGFIFIALVIVVGQALIVETGGKMFNVVPLTASDFAAILIATSPILLIAEALKTVSKQSKNSKKHSTFFAN